MRGRRDPRAGDARASRHAHVVAYLALFCALAGSAWAAATIGSGDVVNNSLKSVDLRNNGGVKSPDVRNSSLGGGDVRNGSLAGGEFGANSIAGADVNEATLRVSRVFHRLGGPVGRQLSTSIAYKKVPNNDFVQAAGESDQIFAGGRVTFPATCTAPRAATLLMTLDDPTFNPMSTIGIAQVVDNSPGAVSKVFTFGSSPFGTTGLSLFRTGASVERELFVQAAASCSSGAGTSLDSININVTGHLQP